MIQYFEKKDAKLLRLEERKHGCWINITPPFESDELLEFSNKLEIPLDFLTDPLDIDERSRYEREDDIRLIIINLPVINPVELESHSFYITVPLGIILTPEHVITISSQETPVIERFFDGKVKVYDPAYEQIFVMKILEQNVLWYLQCLKRITLKSNLIEQELQKTGRNQELQDLLKIEKSLVYFVNSLSANELLMMKMKRTDFLRIKDNEDQEDFFEDIIIDYSQALEMANVHTNILSGTMDTYASIISNNVNTFIQRLTIITIVLMVPTLVSSFYGMNLAKLPFQDDPNAFYYAIMFSVLIGFLTIMFFRRKNNF
jgi:magnesium transporter